ncbi:MAG: polysaccharide deacetylase family protein, partial [Candidatus Binataceae bacterium]
MEPRKFEVQIRWLARHGYQSIRARDLLCWQRGGTALPARPVLLTFDDGFEDLAEHALPVLRRYGFTATVFVITGLSGGDGMFEERRVMTREQIRYWAGEGIEFGSHTRTHADLTVLDSSALESEIAGSADDLRKILDRPVELFAYPYGRISAAAQRIVGRFYAAAFTCEEGLNDRATDLSLLRRTIVHPKDTLPEFSARLRFGRNPLRPLFKPYRAWRRLREALEVRLGGGR